MRRLLLPTAVLAAALALDRGWPGALSEPALLWASRGLFAAAFLLAWRFRRGRLAAAALVMGLAGEAVRLGPVAASDAWRPAVACLLPLDLALLAAFGEWRVLSLAGLPRYGVLAVQGYAVFALAGGAGPAIEAWLRRPWVDSLPPAALPQSALFAFVLALAVLAALVVRRRTPLEAGLLGALAAAFLAFELAAPFLYLAAGGAVLALSQIENAFSLAFEDGLTRLPARRALEEALSHPGRRYAVAMVDIDHFKRLNDRHGHECGDQVLRRVAGRLARVGGGGTAYRYGGEEFTILFTGRSAKDVESHLEALRRAIADRPFVVRAPSRPKKRPRPRRGGGGRRLKVTVSIGAADRNARRRRPEQVMKAADRALYRAKRAGRNRLVVG